MSVLEDCREKLLAAGFTQATKHPRNFYRELTDQTALVIDLSGNDACCDVTYGISSTSFSKSGGSDTVLKAYGIDPTEITLRFFGFVLSEQSAAELEESIRALYLQYRDTDKEVLLAHVKEKRKAFLARFAVALKPLGFRKKGNTWSKPLPGGADLIFQLQKSGYEDCYYFNLIRQYPKTYPWISHDRLQIDGVRDPYDWQLLSESTVEQFLQKTLLKQIEEMLARYGI